MLVGDDDYECSTLSYKRRKLTDLTLAEKLQIFEDIAIKKDYHDNVSARYRVSR